MTSTSVSSNHLGKTFSAPALAVSIAIAIFAVVTQLLAATGATSLSTTQQLTMWLVAAGLIVLLWIAYMICRAYVTAKRSEEALARLKACAEKAETEAAQARAAAGEADTRRDKALAAKVAAEQEAEAARAQIAEARRAAEKAETEAAQARAAAGEADTRQERDEAVRGAQFRGGRGRTWPVEGWKRGR